MRDVYVVYINTFGTLLEDVETTIIQGVYPYERIAKICMENYIMLHTDLGYVLDKKCLNKEGKIKYRNGVRLYCQYQDNKNGYFEIHIVKKDFDLYSLKNLRKEG